MRETVCGHILHNAVIAKRPASRREDNCDKVGRNWLLTCAGLATLRASTLQYNQTIKVCGARGGQGYGAHHNVGVC